jgi:hypothetical protein
MGATILDTEIEKETGRKKRKELVGQLVGTKSAEGKYILLINKCTLILSLQIEARTHFLSIK